MVSTKKLTRSLIRFSCQNCNTRPQNPGFDELAFSDEKAASLTNSPSALSASIRASSARLLFHLEVRQILKIIIPRHTSPHSSFPAALTRLLLSLLVPLNTTFREAELGSFAALINNQTVDLREQEYLSVPHSHLPKNFAVELSSMPCLDLP